VIRRCAAFVKCSHIPEYAALSKTPHALADGLILVFQHPAKANGVRQPGFYRAAPAMARGLTSIKD